MSNTKENSNLPLFLVAAGVAAVTLAASLAPETSNVRPAVRRKPSRTGPENSEATAEQLRKDQNTEAIEALKKQLKSTTVEDGESQAKFLAGRYLILAELARLDAKLNLDELDSIGRELASFHRNCIHELIDATEMQVEVNLCLRLDPEKPDENINFALALPDSQAGKVLRGIDEFNVDEDFAGIAHILDVE